MNSNTSQLFKTRKLAGNIPGEAPRWIGCPLTNGTASPEEVAAIVAEDTRQSVSDVVYTHTKTGEAVRRLLRAGQNVNLDWVAFTIALTGAFESLDDGFEQGRNALMVRAHARQFLRDCLADVSPRNVTNGLKASIQSVIDSAAQAEGIITTVTVYVAGLSILVDENPDEGVWLVSKDGTIAATPTITANTATTMDLSFGELPPDGSYTLVVKARSGASTDYAPAIAKRNVTVQRAG